MYNDKEAIRVLLSVKNIKSLFSNKKEVYRVFRGKTENDYSINQYGITSASTKKDNMIDEFKDMISQYKKTGNFYQQTISNVVGIDVNKLHNNLKGDIQRLKRIYDVPGNEPISAMIDAFKQLKDQKEFIIFGDYKIKAVREL